MDRGLAPARSTLAMFPRLSAWPPNTRLKLAAPVLNGSGDVRTSRVVEFRL